MKYLSASVSKLFFSNKTVTTYSFVVVVMKNLILLSYLYVFLIVPLCILQSGSVSPSPPTGPREPGVGAELVTSHLEEAICYSHLGK